MDRNIKLENGELRAIPRKRKENEAEQPVFLRKAFAMITDCPPEIGGWSESGCSFIIKDVVTFTEKVIPQSYKHNHFSSFVRQLNFYGFRKIRSEQLKHASWWEFRHEYFVKGKPHLLSQIKKSVHYVNPGEVNCSDAAMSTLKSEVSSMQERMDKMNSTINELTGMLSKTLVLSPDSTAVAQIPTALLTAPLARKRRALQQLDTHTAAPARAVGAAAAGHLPVTVKVEPGTHTVRKCEFVDTRDQGGECEGVDDALDLLAGLDDEEIWGDSVTEGGTGLVVGSDPFDSWFDLTADEWGLLGTPRATLQVSDDKALPMKQAAGSEEVTCSNKCMSISRSTSNNNNNNNSNNQSDALPPVQQLSADDISAIIGRLAPHLQERFVDKLAAHMGSQMTSIFQAATAAVSPPYNYNCQAGAMSAQVGATAPSAAAHSAQPQSSGAAIFSQYQQATAACNNTSNYNNSSSNCCELDKNQMDLAVAATLAVVQSMYAGARGRDSDMTRLSSVTAPHHLQRQNSFEIMQHSS